MTKVILNKIEIKNFKGVASAEIDFDSKETILEAENGCVDCDTEFFNGKQWKKISQWKPQDKVLQFNIDGTANLVKPIKYHKYKCETLTEIKTYNETVNQCVCNNHRMIYVTDKDIIREKLAGDLIQILNEKHRFGARIIPFFRYSGQGIPLTDAEIKLCIACSAEGNKPCKNDYWRINLKKQYKKDNLEKILTECNILFKKKKYNKDLSFDTYLFHFDKGFKKFPVSWYQATQEQMRLIGEELVLWDGTVSNKKAKIYRTTLKDNADFVQFLYSSQGKRTSIKIDDRIGQGYGIDGKYKRKSICYEVHQCTKTSLINLKNSKGIIVNEYKTKDGFKYCFSVPSGMLVLRRGNSINITGNCGKSSIKNAFEWALCQNVADVLPMLNNKEIPHLETSVVVKLTINGYDYTLERQSKGKYLVNEETGTENKITNESKYFIDGMEMKEKDYKEKIASLLSNGVFENLQMLTDKEYFNTDTTKFKWTDRRKILFEMCGVKDATQELIMKPQYAPIRDYIVKGNATSDVKSMLTKAKKGYKDQQVKNNILIEQKVKENAVFLETDYEQVEKDLQGLQEKHKALLSASNAEQQTETLKALQNKILEYTREKSVLENAELMEKTKLRTLMQSLFNEAQNLKLEFDVEKDNYQRLDSGLKVGDTCPTCHQKIEKIDEQHNKEQAELIEKSKIKLEKLKENYTLKKAEFEETKQKLDNFVSDARIKELETLLISTKTALEQTKGEDLNNLSAKEIIALEGQISALTKKLRDKEYIDINNKNIAMWKDANKSLADQIIDIEKKETALANFMKEQTDLVVKTVNDHFSNGVSWALYNETYKNGEGGIEEDCVCMLNGKRYSSLSMGEKNKANLEVVKTLQEYYGVELPVFFDNAETTSIDYNFDGQIIKLFAKKGAKLENVVKIEDIYKGE